MKTCNVACLLLTNLMTAAEEMLADAAVTMQSTEIDSWQASCYENRNLSESETRNGASMTAQD